MTIASATPSQATRVVLKMPTAMPARSFGTTLTASPSISPQGKAMPTPISTSGATRAMATGGVRLSQTRPAAAISRPTPQIVAGAIQRATWPASKGRISSGPDRQIINCPALISLIPSMPMKRIGNSTSRTTKP